MSDPSQDPTGGSGRHGSSLNFVRAALVVVLFAIVVGFVLADATGNYGRRHRAASTTTTSVPTGTSSTTTTTVARSSVKVQVANGSTTAGVATTITQQLQTLGWDTLPPVNASSTVPASVVYYAANRKPQALEIASELKLAATAVQPLTTSVPVANASGDDVVVVVGPDLAQS